MASSVSSDATAGAGEAASAEEGQSDDGNETIPTLDDDALEKVIAKLPCKQLFQTPTLSKTWQMRFRSPALHSEVQRTSAASWPSYAPVLYNDRSELVGYESSSRSWVKLPSHPDLLPDMLLQNWCLKAGDGSLLCWKCDAAKHTKRGVWMPVNMKLEEWSRIAGDGSLQCGGCGGDDPCFSLQKSRLRQKWSLRAGGGSLLCWTCKIYIHDPDPTKYTPNCNHLFISNPLTKSWRQLPPRPDTQWPRCFHVVVEKNGAYKVILGAWDGLAKCLRVQVFDSTDGSWTQDSCQVEEQRCGGSAFVNGLFHAVVNTSGPKPSSGCLISFDLESRTWKMKYLWYAYLPDPRRRLPPLEQFPHSEIVVSGKDVMVVMFHPADDFCDYDDGLDHPTGALSVFTLNLQRGYASEVSRISNEKIVETSFGWAGGRDDGCIYIGDRSAAIPTLAYDVGTRRWSYIRYDNVYWGYRWLWTSVTYEPGVHPFLVV